MTSTSENLPAPERVIVPCRLIFWGIIICTLDLKLNGFDIINNFVGMLMILYGVAALYSVPISRRYRQWMAFPLVLVIFITLASFYGDVVLPFCPTLQPPPNEIIFAMFFLAAFISPVSIIVFCRCMRDYCTVMTWERARASWGYSERLITYGILIPFAVLAIPIFFFLNTLKFSYIGSLQPSVSGVQSYVDFGYYRASIDETLGYTNLILFVVIFLVAWALIHFLMSLSRMIYAAQKPRVEAEGNTLS